MIEHADSGENAELQKAIGELQAKERAELQEAMEKQKAIREKRNRDKANEEKSREASQSFVNLLHMYWNSGNQELLDTIRSHIGLCQKKLRDEQIEATEKDYLNRVSKRNSETAIYESLGELSVRRTYPTTILVFDKRLQLPGDPSLPGTICVFSTYRNDVKRIRTLELLDGALNITDSERDHAIDQYLSWRASSDGIEYQEMLDEALRLNPAYGEERSTYSLPREETKEQFGESVAYKIANAFESVGLSRIIALPQDRMFFFLTKGNRLYSLFEGAPDSWWLYKYDDDRIESISQFYIGRSVRGGLAHIMRQMSIRLSRKVDPEPLDEYVPIVCSEHLHERLRVLITSLDKAGVDIARVNAEGSESVVLDIGDYFARLSSLELTLETASTVGISLYICGRLGESYDISWVTSDSSVVGEVIEEIEKEDLKNLN